MSIQTKQEHASQIIDELYQNSFFQRYWRAIGLFLGRGKPTSLWVSVVIVMGVNLLLGITVSALLGETLFTTLTAILVNFMWAAYGFLIIPLFINTNTKIIEFLRLRFVKSLQEEHHLQELRRWASQWLGNRKLQFFISFVFGVAIAHLSFYSIYPSAKYSVGQVLIYFVCFFHAAVAVYTLFSLLAFVSLLDRLSLALYPDDPASSPILLQLSKQLGEYILFLAFAGAGLLLLNGLVNTLNIKVILLTLVVDWVPILALFILGNQAFSKQISRVKYDRLEKLQSEIMKLSSNVEKMNTDTIARVKSLVDYHDRVKSSRNSLYNSASFINLIGSLALPLLSAVLSTIDIWQKIFGRP